MAKKCYNTFVVAECKSGKAILVTSSARKATETLCKGRRIEVWNANRKVETIYAKQPREKSPMQPYIQAEREYIGQKQKAAEERNRCRRIARL